jgi:rare lipoprotein A
VPPSGASSTLAQRYGAAAPLDRQQGEATYYADSLAGHSTASGEPYRPELFTAAHRSLPFGTVVRVVRTDTGRVTYAKINDRGPFGKRTRIIDLSRAAAQELAMMRAGVVPVRVEVVERPAASATR